MCCASLVRSLSVCWLLVSLSCATPARPVTANEADTEDLLPDSSAGAASSSASSDCFKDGVCIEERALSGGVSCHLHAVALDSGVCIVETERRPLSIAEGRVPPTLVPCGAEQDFCEQPFRCDCRQALPAKPCPNAEPRRIEVQAPDGARCEATVMPPEGGACEASGVVTRAGNGGKKRLSTLIRLAEVKKVCAQPFRCACDSFSVSAGGDAAAQGGGSTK